MRAVFSRFGLRKSTILLLSVLGIGVYAACTPSPSDPPPSTPIISGPGSTGTTNSVTFGYQSQAGTGALSYKCRLNNGGEFDCGLSTWGVWVYQTITVADGQNTFYVRTIDDRGKISGTASYSWLADATRPTGGSVSAPSVSDTGTFNLSVNYFSDPHSGMRQNNLITRSGTLVNGTCQNYTGWQSTGTSLSNLPTGCYDYSVQGENGVGLWSSDTKTVIVDRSSPTGGGIASPEWSSTGGFSLNVTNFSDPESGISRNWTVRTPSNARAWSDVFYANGLFVATGSPNGNEAPCTCIMTSSDGVNWTARTAEAYYDIAYGNGLFVAAGVDSVSTSPDGINWTKRNIPGSFFREGSIVYGGGRFVGVGTGTVVTSTDGINWSAQSSPIANPYFISYGNGSWVVTGASPSNNHSAPVVMTSSDGLIWTARSGSGIPYSSTYGYSLSSITYDEGFFWALAGTGNSGGSGRYGGSPYALLKSSNGYDWSTQSTFATVGTPVDLEYTNGLFSVLINSSITHSAILTSLDGNSWTTNPLPTSYNNSMAYGNGVFVIVNQYGDVASSSNLTGNRITREKGTLSSGNCSLWGSPVDTGIAQSNLGEGCYRYTLRSLNGVNKEMTATSITKVDTTPPAGGSVVVPTYDNDGTFGFVQNNFSDAQSGMKSNTLQRRFVSNLWAGNTTLSFCPSDSDPSWSAWENTTTNQTGLTTGCWQYRLTGTNNADLSTVSPVGTTKVDTSTPVDGVLRVNSTAASAAGTSSWNNTGSFSINERIDFTDPHSAMSAWALTRESADLNNGTCGTYGTTRTGDGTLSGTPAQSGLATACYRYTLSGTNNAGGIASVSTVVRVDATAPTGGALTVNSTAASAAGTSSWNNTGAVTIGTRTDFSDAHSGMASNTLLRESADLNNGTCGTYGTTRTGDGTLTGTPAQSGLATACYRYTLSGTNNVSLAATPISTVVRVDTSAPTGGTVSSPAWSSSGTYSVAVTNFSDSHSGMLSNNLQGRSGTLGSSGCSGYSATWSTVSPSQNNLAEGCYQYRLLGTNGAGGEATSPISETRVDKTAPAVSFSLDSPVSSPTKANSWSYTLTFRHGSGGYLESVSGLSGSVSSVVSNAVASSSGGATGCSFEALGTGSERKILVSGCSEGLFRPRLAAAAVSDTAGNSNAASEGSNLIIDRTDPEEPPCLEINGNCSGPGDPPPGGGDPSATNGISGCVGEAGDSGWFRSNLTCYIYVTETFVGSAPQAPRLEVQENWGGSNLQTLQNETTQLVTGAAASNLPSNQRLYLGQFSVSTQRSDIYLRIRIIDQASNESSEINTFSGPFARGPIKIDKLAPENPAIDANASKNCNNESAAWQDGDWFKEAECAFLNPLDTASPNGGRAQASGIDRFQYKVCPYGLSEAACNSKDWSAVNKDSDVFSPSEDGAYKILLRTQDRAGWPSANISRFVKVDSTAPVNTAGFTDVIYPDENGYPLVSVNARDLRKGTLASENQEGGYSSSGLASLECYLVDASNPVGGQEISNSSSSSCQETIRDDDLALRWVARDLAKSSNGQAVGNVREGVINPRIDMNRPALEVLSAPSGWEQQAAEVTLLASDSGGNNAGVQAIDLVEEETYYSGLGKKNGSSAAPSTEVCGPVSGGGMQCTYRFTTEGNRRYKFVARDGSKRASTPVSVWVKIDRSRPTSPGAISYNPDSNRWSGPLKVSGEAADDAVVVIDNQTQAGSGNVRGRVELCLEGDIDPSTNDCNNPITVNHSVYSSYLPSRESLGVPCSPTIEAQDSKYVCWIDGNRLNSDAQEAQVAVALETLRARFVAQDAAGNKRGGSWTNPLQASGRMCSLPPPSG